MTAPFTQTPLTESKNSPPVSKIRLAESKNYFADCKKKFPE
jgi:hypothetical protein